MKISLVSLGQTSAGPVYSLEMAKALAVRTDCQLQVIISKGVDNLPAWNDAFLDSNVDYHVIDSYRRTKTSVLMNNFNYAKQERLVKLIKGFGADVLYLPFGFMWARYVYWRLHKTVRIVSTIHDVKFHDSIFNLSIAELGSYVLNYGTGKFVHGFIILNQKDKTVVEYKHKKPVCVIPHASYSYYFRNKTVGKVDQIHKCIGFFGRIEVYKGVDLLVDAYSLARVKDLKLIIAGGGNIEPGLISKIKNNSNITLINRFIEDSEIPELLSKIDFVVLPYKRASQSGVIPLCFAAGKTVIATKVGALEEQVPNGTGVLVEPNVAALSSAIIDMYNNPLQIRKMGDTAQVYAETELSWTHSAELLIKFIKELCR